MVQPIRAIARGIPQTERAEKNPHCANAVRVTGEERGSRDAPPQQRTVPGVQDLSGTRFHRALFLVANHLCQQLVVLREPATLVTEKDGIAFVPAATPVRNVGRLGVILRELHYRTPRVVTLLACHWITQIPASMSNGRKRDITPPVVERCAASVRTGARVGVPGTAPDTSVLDAVRQLFDAGESVSSAQCRIKRRLRNIAPAEKDSLVPHAVAHLACVGLGIAEEDRALLVGVYCLFCRWAGLLEMQDTTIEMFVLNMQQCLAPRAPAKIPKLLALAAASCTGHRIDSYLPAYIRQDLSVQGLLGGTKQEFEDFMLTVELQNGGVVSRSWAYASADRWSREVATFLSKHV